MNSNNNYTDNLRNVMLFLSIYNDDDYDYYNNNNYISNFSKCEEFVIFISNNYYNIKITQVQASDIVFNLFNFFPDMNFYHINEYIKNIGKLILLKGDN